MYFLNRGYNSFWMIGIVLLGVFLFMNFLPFILLAVVIGLAVRYAYKHIKSWGAKASDRVNTKNKYTYKEAETQENQFDIKNVIDVEYTEVK